MNRINEDQSLELGTLGAAEYIYLLMRYGEAKELFYPGDRRYVKNRLLSCLGLDEAEAFSRRVREALRKKSDDYPLPLILRGLIEIAEKQGLVDASRISSCDRYDAELMDCLMPRPSEVQRHFSYLYKTQSPLKATQYFYALSQNSNYIRRDRIAKDLHWTCRSKYGTIEISVNLSKPEKDPRDIAAALEAKSSSYPECALCKESEGYAGRENFPGRANHRIIPVELDGRPYFFQYSPYVYYTEHCIVLSSAHVPMKISRGSMTALFDFIEIFPHYFLGSNADLPIVGGSILSHDHFQGGNHKFPMENAKRRSSYKSERYSSVEIQHLEWPLTSLRLSSNKRSEVLDLAEEILNAWRSYSDPDFNILAETDEASHNTITCIARRYQGAYQMDLVLRNNRCDAEHPMGIFHPHAEKHHIKKENIGLIEVMGLAVLPARLRDEIEAMVEKLELGESLRDDPLLEKHADWIESITPRKQFKSRDEIRKFLEREIGRVFVSVLEDCAVFPLSSDGDAGLEKFLARLAIKSNYAR